MSGENRTKAFFPELYCNKKWFYVTFYTENKRMKYAISQPPHLLANSRIKHFFDPHITTTENLENFVQIKKNLPEFFAVNCVANFDSSRCSNLQALRRRMSCIVFHYL